MIREIKALKEILIGLQEMTITKQFRNHHVGNKVYDIHLSDNVVLLYKYDNDMLVVSLKLGSLSFDHKELNKDIRVFDDRPSKYEIDTDGEVMSLDDIKTSMENKSFDERWDKKFGKPRTDVFTTDDFNEMLQEMIDFE